MLPKLIIVAVAAFLGLFVWKTFAPKQLPINQHIQEQNQPASTESAQHIWGSRSPFYNQDGISLTHSWPGEEFFSNEETEVLIFNQSNSSVEVKSWDLTYQVEGKPYPHKSGTWEKFSSWDSPERIDYVNISPQYYLGQPLVMEPGQKGKLHWHIQFGNEPLDGKQTVHLKLTLLKDGQTINIDETFNRESGAVFSKDEH